MHEAFRPYLTELRSQLAEGLDSAEVEDAVCEIGAHLELAYEEGLRQGLTHGQAYNAALHSLGSTSKELARDLEQHSFRFDQGAADLATLVFAWASSALYVLSLMLLPGYSRNLGFWFFPISSLPTFAFALLMVSSFLSGRYRPFAVACAPLCCFGLFVSYLMIKLTNLDFVVPYLINLSCMFILGHLLMVWLRRYSGERQHRRIAS